MSPGADGPLVLGIGNRHRRDDAVGLEVAAQLAGAVDPGVRVLPFEGASTDLLDLWSGVSFVILVDALAPRGTPGRVHRFEGDLAARLAGPSPSSTHGLSAGEVWSLGASLGQLPRRLVVFGVEGADFSPGVGLSPEVARAVGPLTESVLRELRGGIADA